MTSHSAEDKAHWFLPDGEVGGGGGFDGATQGRVKEAARKKRMLLQRCVLLRVICPEGHLHTCYTADAGRFHMQHVCIMGDAERVPVHTRVPNECVNAIMHCLPGQ